MKTSSGFTLIELLVVMAIVSILTLVAIPQFREYRARGFDTRAKIDLRNVAIAEEAYFIDQEKYLSCSNGSCSELPGIATLSAGVDLSISASDTAFTGTATHPQGTGKVFKWDSERGGFVE